MKRDVAAILRCFGYDPEHPVGRDHEVPLRLINALSEMNTEALVKGSLVVPGNEVTAREAEVLAYLSRGLTERMVADALSIDRETVKTHVQRVRFKLQSKNTTHACCEALRQGLIR